MKKIFGNKKWKLLCVNDSINIDERNIIFFKKLLEECYLEKLFFEKWKVKYEILFKRRIFKWC